MDNKGVPYNNPFFGHTFVIFILYHSVRMIHLGENEKILMVLHRHWIVVVGKFVASVFLAVLPILAIPLILASSIIIIPESAGPIILFLSVIYLMILILLLFVFWIDYYLDMWIITSERIMDIEQTGLFHRQISEFMLDKVQDITVEIPDMVATFLKYGNLVIQTAGEKSFEIKQIHNVYEAKNTILDAAKILSNKNNNVRT
ncbi:MAG: hypothetical protein UW30_C0004G0013 [Candidatus Giovannonibacteria bacterium GW2011_GWA2_44_13b]|uniref:DUF304 domain-containing protein n=2 Tax=Candidatus Giovannoniibacteriota TaxID=1752738 RepID=A0A0G1K1X8_9BACT|nr:MAG: hypothetical protein UW30_C0004G0013 [Candidatus Giovannonibacteria bacterium GW2011_GWA2_44_13b]